MFHIVTGNDVNGGSTFGTARLLQNGNVIASYTCSQHACKNDVSKPLNQRFAKDGAVLSYEFTCTGDPGDPTGTCADPGFRATITVNYELATATP